VIQVFVRNDVLVVEAIADEPRKLLLTVIPEIEEPLIV
jgi:hypothetical protein